MPADKQLGLLQDILDSARLIAHYLNGVSKMEFMENFEKQDAVLRRFEIIGEAANGLAPETRALFPEVPFRQMRGMRNIIAHDYGEVDLDQVWQTSQANLPQLIDTLDRFMRVNGSAEGD